MGKKVRPYLVEWSSTKKKKAGYQRVTASTGSSAINIVKRMLGKRKIKEQGLFNFRAYRRNF